MHIIPDLKRLEKKYANQLVVIGVHSAKFSNEKETDNIRRIILRYELEHPVVNDADFTIWKAYAVNAWPTQYLIDPAGYVVGFVRGEGNFELLDEAIGKTVEEFRKRGELNEQPLGLALERAKVGDLMSRLSQDLNTVQEATGAVLVQGVFLLLSALAAAMSTVNASTGPSIRTSSSPRTLAGARCTSSAIDPYATARPIVEPTAARATLSVSS